MKKCETCFWFIKQKPRMGDSAGVVIGECKDAIKRARLTVPFSVNLDVSMVFGHGGKECPAWTDNQPLDLTQKSTRKSA